MKLNFIKIMFFLFLADITTAQVGINTMTPNAAFDVEVNENISKNQDIVGIKIPIISKQQLGEKTAYGQNQTGTIVFVNDLNYTGNNPAVANVEDNKYFYIFNGDTWRSSVYTLSASTFIITSNEDQGFQNIDNEQPIILYQNSDVVTPNNSSLFTYSLNGEYLEATENGLYGISGFIFFRPRPESGVNTNSQSIVKLSVQKKIAGENDWTTISSVSKYFYGTTGYLGSTIPIPENILSLNQYDRIRLTITLPSQVGSIDKTGFYSSIKNIGIFPLSGSTGGNHYTQNISRSISIQKL